MNLQKLPFIIKFYIHLFHYSQYAFHCVLDIFNGFFSGFWLGVLSREVLQRVDQSYYDNEKMYHDEQYNQSGLSHWEKACVEKYFPGKKSILLIGAGGGREVLALNRMGFEVDGYECNPCLVQYANEFFAKESISARVRMINRDHGPKTSKQYEGIVVGWGAYMLIQGRKHRISFLKELRKNCLPDSPLLLSFFPRRKNTLHFILIPGIGNIFRWLMGKEFIEIGDDAVPDYVHYFTEQEIASELAEAGFQMDFYSTLEYGHAVGIAH